MKTERYDSDRAAHFAHLNYLIRVTGDPDGRWAVVREEYRRLVPEEGGGIDPRSALAAVLAFYHQEVSPIDVGAYVDAMARNQEARSHSATTKRHYRREHADV